MSAPGGGGEKGEGVLSEKLSGGVRHASRNPDPNHTRSVIFFTPFQTWSKIWWAISDLTLSPAMRLISLILTVQWDFFLPVFLLASLCMIEKGSENILPRSRTRKYAKRSTVLFKIGKRTKTLYASDCGNFRRHLQINVKAVWFI